MVGFKKKNHEADAATGTSNMCCTAMTLGSTPLLWAGFKKRQTFVLILQVCAA